MSEAESMGLNRMMSSAYRISLELLDRDILVIPFMMLNSSGPRMEPCGTPDRTAAESGVTPSSATRWYLSVSCGQRKRDPLIPSFRSELSINV